MKPSRRDMLRRQRMEEAAAWLLAIGLLVVLALAGSWVIEADADRDRLLECATALGAQGVEPREAWLRCGREVGP